MLVKVMISDRQQLQQDLASQPSDSLQHRRALGTHPLAGQRNLHNLQIPSRSLRQPPALESQLLDIVGSVNHLSLPWVAWSAFTAFKLWHACLRSASTACFSFRTAITASPCFWTAIADNLGLRPTVSNSACIRTAIAAGSVSKPLCQASGRFRSAISARIRIRAALTACLRSTFTANGFCLRPASCTWWLWSKWLRPTLAACRRRFRTAKSTCCHEFRPTFAAHSGCLRTIFTASDDDGLRTAISAGVDRIRPTVTSCHHRF